MHNIIQHTITATHQERLKKLSWKNIKQQTIKELIATSSSDEQKTFYSDLCNAMISSNIPLKRLDNGEVKCFLEKYCSRHIPSESTIHKNYVDSLHEEVMDELKSNISNNFIWFSVDEITDVCERYIANLMIGILHEESPTKASKELEKTNSNTVTKFVHDELTKIFYLIQLLLKKYC
jgi:Glu-tRNA(Gln) amidotransferase subunit E-like FAD-binding protein